MIKYNLSNKQRWEHLKDILLRTKEGNDILIKTLSDLHIVLINLKIEAAHITADTNIKTGIVPIADEVERILDRIDKGVHDITKDRAKSLECIDILTEYFKDIE